MTVIAILALACVVGYVLGRWWFIGLGFAVGVLALGAGMVTVGGAADSPAIFVAVLAALAVALGVITRQRIESRRLASSRATDRRDSHQS